MYELDGVKVQEVDGIRAYFMQVPIEVDGVQIHKPYCYETYTMSETSSLDDVSSLDYKDPALGLSCKMDSLITGLLLAEKHFRISDEKPDHADMPLIVWRLRPEICRTSDPESGDMISTITCRVRIIPHKEKGPVLEHIEKHNLETLNNA